ncbi:hypothetical protein GN244_ATG18985 [Phytophthora infestans]|uniref:Uncharacterized protein n=1 Tax=Phytophthora infestans TaxID=4787 RepID=A0A833SVQ0_PHYIN|nr:hypothetical protein GN244_ATG18985 [Phytophthora infestans]
MVLPGPLQSKNVVGARLLLLNKLNFRTKFSERSKKKELKAVFFNSSKFTHLPERVGCDLDGKRLKGYLDSLTGKLQNGDEERLKVLGLELPRVEISGRVEEALRVGYAIFANTHWRIPFR